MNKKRVFIVFFLLITMGAILAFCIENVYPQPLSIVSTNVSLKWVGAVGTYYVYMGNSQYNLTFVGSTTSFSFKPKLFPDRIYWWSVLKKSGNTYSYGPISSFTTLPSSPTLTYPMDNSTVMSTSVELKWRGDGPFVVKLGLSPESMIKIGATDKRRIEVFNLNPNTKYFWQVIKRGKHASSKSAIFSFSTKPLSVFLLYPKNGESDVATTVIFKWQSIPEETYTLYIGTSVNLMKRVASNLPISSFKGKLLPSTTYYWQVTAKGISLLQAYSKIANFKTLQILEPPAFPSPSSGSIGIPSNVLLSWKFQKNVKYNLYVGENPKNLDLIAKSIDVSSYNLRGLKENNWYYWRVASILGNRHVFGPLWKFKTRKGSWHLTVLNTESFKFPYQQDNQIRLGRVFAKAIILPSDGRVEFQIRLVKGPESGLYLFFGNERDFMKVAAGISNVNALLYKEIKLGEDVTYESPILHAGTYYLYIQNNVIYQNTTLFGNISSQWEIPAQIDYSIELWY